MIKIYNSLIPFPGFVAINIFGMLFVRKEYKAYVKDTLVNHERIHTEQMKDLFFVPYYIIYVLEWLFRVLFVHPFSHEAYRSISFEREAFENEKNLKYIDGREPYAMWKRK